MGSRVGEKSLITEGVLGLPLALRNLHLGLKEVLAEGGLWEVLREERRCHEVEVEILGFKNKF